ncbi:MAG: type VI secretion system tip protein TssI/VgrG [Polyangiaceae bacterium]
MESSKNLQVSISFEEGPWQDARVYGLRGREAISDLFEFEVDVALPADVEVDEWIHTGKTITLGLEIPGRVGRPIRGIVDAVWDRLEATGSNRTCTIRVVPPARALGLVVTQEVFLDASVPDLIRLKLEAHGFEKETYDLRLQETYPAREIVVQFGESDLAFVRRLAEQAGIAFHLDAWGEHDKWVFSDHNAAFRAMEEPADLRFHARGEHAGVFELVRASRTVPGTFFVQDYNHRTPLLDPTGQHTIDGDAPGGVVEFGAHVKSPEEAKRLAKVRAEESHARRVVFEGKSTVFELTAGRHFVLADHPRFGDGLELLVTEVTHEATFPLQGEVARGEPRYENRFTAIPREVPYRPARTTPRPKIHGVVTGVVQPGPKGEVGGVAKLTDDGRYIVQLHFDTAERGQQRASHPIRMAQPFAGHGNGMHFPLLPGTEVIVAFANGDPDRPVIVGALPNAISPSPIVAEESHTHRIQSSKGVVMEFGTTILGGT